MSKELLPLPEPDRREEVMYGQISMREPFYSADQMHEYALANLQAAKPAEGSLPVVAWLRTSGTGSPVLTAEFLKSFPSHKHCFERPLVELSMATAEINNLKAEIDKRDWCVAEKMAELTRLRAQMEGVEKQLRESQSKYFDLRKLLDERPAVNQGLFEAYQVWTGKVYSLDVLDAMDKMKGDDE